MNKTLKILSIETSCDETAIAILEFDKIQNKYKVLADSLNSQIDIHKEFGGVFPALAKREHGNNLLGLLMSCLNKIENGNEADINDKNIDIELLNREDELSENIKKFPIQKIPDIDYIAVTRGPGLEPALWVGLSFAKFLSKLWQKPILPINHMEGHLSSILLENNMEEFPTLALLISGGHTELVDIENWGKYNIIGKTRDDAIGEAYDKAARILGLSYPGGPEIAKRAKIVRENKSLENIKLEKDKQSIKLPRPMIKSQDLDLSFSGLKTAVLYMVRDMKKIRESLDENIINMICHEFEESVLEVLLSKLNFAYYNNQEKYKNLIAAGGVIANEFLRENIDTWCSEKKINFLRPNIKLATDNAIMIGLAAIIGLKHNYIKIIHPDTEEYINLIPDGDWSLNNI